MFQEPLKFLAVFTGPWGQFNANQAGLRALLIQYKISCLQKCIFNKNALAFNSKIRKITKRTEEDEVGKKLERGLGYFTMI